MTASDERLLFEGTELLNRTQGRGLFPDDYLKKAVDTPNTLITGALQDDNLLGISQANLITDFSYYLPFDPEIAISLQGDCVGSFSTMSVIENARGCGIGQSLSRHRLSWLRDQSCTTILGVSWVSGFKHTSDKVFEKLGFQRIKEVKRFFQAQAEKNPFDCPGCNIQPCECAAILYRYDTKPNPT